MPKPSPRYLGKMRKSSSKGDVPQTESPAATPKGEDKRKCSTPQGESEAASTIQKRFRRRSTGQKAEPGASSPGGAAAPKRKSMIPGFMRKKSTSEEEEAAVKIQARFRGLKVRQTGGSTKHINTSIIPKQLRQAGEAIDESFINFKTGVAQKAAAKGAALVRATPRPRARVPARAHYTSVPVSASAGHQDRARDRPVDPKERRKGDRDADHRADR